MQLILEAHGYETAIAHDGREALAAVARARPSLVLLDLRMPVMDGWQFARELAARYDHEVPVVVVSAAEHLRAQAGDLGACDVLPKPFEASELVACVGQHRRATVIASHGT
jgi:DNA-binding response OmpR family regulator